MRFTVAVAVALHASAAAAEPLRALGLLFSDELGGVELVSVGGSGTAADPLVVVEELTDPNGATLIIRGMSTGFPNLTGSHHQSGFVLRKVVRNATGRDWRSFDLELRHDPLEPSTYGDGLSFGQASDVGRPFLSSHMSEGVELLEPNDSVAFGGGEVKVGAVATFEVIVTHSWATGRDIHLLQHPDRRLARLLP